MSLSYDYYPLVLQVIEAIGKGLTETRACDEANIGVVTFKKYLKNDDNLREQYEEAMQRGYDAMAEALLDPFGRGTYGETDAQKAALVSNNLKWFLSKRNARVYGERVEVAHTITADRVITQALERARLRNQGGEIVDVTPNAVPMALIEQVVDDTDEAIMRELGLL